MKMRPVPLLSIIFLALAALSCENERCDVLVIGGGTGGVSAALQASRSGAETIIVESGPWLGGMLTSAGVGAIDGNYNMRAGIFGEFCDSIAARYGGYDALRSGWVSNILFEPKVGADVFRNMAAKESGLKVILDTDFERISRAGKGWKVSFCGQDGGRFTVRAEVLIDGTELGDIAAAAGAAYRLGMDAREDSGESIAPEQANSILQDLTYVAILRDYGPDADVTVDRPEDYDPALFEGCTDPWPAREMLNYGRLPSRDLFMLNWPIRGNDCYVNAVEAGRTEREEALKAAKSRTLGFLYYIQTELGLKNIGLDLDQFPTEDGLALIPYYREGRRIRGLAFFTIDYAAKPYDMPLALYKEGIAVGDYAVDHHHGRYPDYEGLPDLHFYPVPSFNVPLRALVPSGTDNLLVADKAVSVSNIMNGATRLQPVIMQIGQAAGATAALAVLTGRTTAQICGAGRYGADPAEEVPEGIREVQQIILDSGGYLMPYIDLKPSDEGFTAIQKVGACGILRGEGHNEGWTNTTEFRINDPLLRSELTEGLLNYRPEAAEMISGNPGECIAFGELPGILLAMGAEPGRIESALASCEECRPIAGSGSADHDGVKQENPEDIRRATPERSLTRLEFSVILDRAIDLFPTAL